MKYLTALLLACLSIYSGGQTKNPNEIEGLTINPKVKNDAEQNIIDPKSLKGLSDGIQFYESAVALEFYENDSLILSTYNNPKTIISKSFYLWRGDTLIIDGGIGLAVGAGFSIKVINNKATVYHMVSSDDSPMYAYGEKTNLLYRLDVPCHDVKAVLSGLPVEGWTEIIYGYVEFKSEDYFGKGEIEDGERSDTRRKVRTNMKMYFRSGPLDLKRD